MRKNQLKHLKFLIIGMTISVLSASSAISDSNVVDRSESLNQRCDSKFRICIDEIEKGTICRGMSTLKIDKIFGTNLSHRLNCSTVSPEYITTDLTEGLNGWKLILLVNSTSEIVNFEMTNCNPKSPGALYRASSKLALTECKNKLQDAKSSHAKFEVCVDAAKDHLIWSGMKSQEFANLFGSDWTKETPRFGREQFSIPLGKDEGSWSIMFALLGDEVYDYSFTILDLKKRKA